MAVLLLALVRLPEGEVPFMREAVADAAPELNAIGDPVFVTLPGDEDLPEDHVGALMLLGLHLPGVA